MDGARAYVNTETQEFVHVAKVTNHTTHLTRDAGRQSVALETYRVHVEDGGSVLCILADSVWQKQHSPEEYFKEIRCALTTTRQAPVTSAVERLAKQREPSPPKPKEKRKFFGPPTHKVKTTTSGCGAQPLIKTKPQAKGGSAPRRKLIEKFTGLYSTAPRGLKERNTP